MGESPDLKDKARRLYEKGQEGVEQSISEHSIVVLKGNRMSEKKGYVHRTSKEGGKGEQE